LIDKSFRGLGNKQTTGLAKTNTNAAQIKEEKLLAAECANPHLSIHHIDSFSCPHIC
jgi:hypothetical protein